MPDTYPKATRSRVMRAVRSSGNLSTELRFVRLLRQQSITGWRRQSRLIGKPDIVFPKQKVAVFLDGCFWHGHPCRNISPKLHRSYWQQKIRSNMDRDKRINRMLRSQNWKVIRIWECKIKSTSPDKLLRSLKTKLMNA